MNELRNGLQPKREITDNIFYLSSPEIKLKISSDLRFIGKVKGDNPVKQEVASRVKDPLENSLQSTSYIFGQTGNGNIFKRGIIIRIHTVMGDPSQTTPALFPGEDRLESGVIQILDEDYRYFILASPEALLKHEQRFLSGFSMPDCFLAKCLEKSGSFGNKTKIQILYLEEISIPDLRCSEWADAGALSEIQRLSLDDFIDRSYSSIRFMEKTKIADRTSKYVDSKEGEPEAGDASRYIETGRGIQQQPIAVGTGDGNIEKRLQTLKELLEKGLITQEDYDQKKTQILENF
ncbi:MAG: SHOCT domain-containing protein [Deltaproteobacteria bacterium]|nr:SHOCT domain-containing protein [Deltaproteobacteria bacterium]